MLRRRSTFALLPFFVLVTLGANCPDLNPSDAGPDDDDDQGLSGSWGNLEDAYHGWIDRCFDETFGGASYAFLREVDPNLFGVGLDRDDFKTAISQLFQDYSENPNIVLDEAAVPACVAAFDDIECSQPDFSACEDVLYGVADLGAACRDGIECDSGYCEGGTSDACGVCAAPVESGGDCVEGEGDEVTHKQCADDLFCNTASGLCEAYIAEDGDCSLAGSQCEDGLYCSSTTETCVSEPVEGESCQDTGYCATDDLECNFQPEGGAICEQKQPEPEDPVAGDACDPADTTYCGDVYEHGLSCVEGPTGGVCTRIEIVDENDACDGPGAPTATQTRWCRFGFTTTFCDVEPGADEGVCRFLPGPGQPCEVGRCRIDQAICAYTSPEGETGCVAAPQEGEPCIDSAASLTYRCGLGLTCGEDDDGVERCVPQNSGMFQSGEMCVEQ